MKVKTNLKGRVQEVVLGMSLQILQQWVRDDLLSWPEDQLEEFLLMEENTHGNQGI